LAAEQQVDNLYNNIKKWKLLMYLNLLTAQQNLL
jgi:hypothetical protein